MKGKESKNRKCITRTFTLSYAELTPRFRRELNLERGELLSRRGALVLIQSVIQKTNHRY